MPDRDPMTDFLSDFTRGGAVRPLPAPEVRRRGDRRRRRQHALAAVGGVAAAAVIAVPFALAAGGGTRQQEPPIATQSPSGSSSAVAQHIPPDFPLARDLPGADAGTRLETGTFGNLPAGSQILTTVPACGLAAWSADGTTELAGVSVSNGEGTEGGETRTLALTPGEGVAAKMLEVVQGQVETCDVAALPADRPEPRSLGLPAGPDSFAFANLFRDEDGGLTGEADVYLFRRAGTAVLVDRGYAQGAGDPAVLQHAVDLLVQRSEGVAAAMCVFTADGC